MPQLQGAAKRCFISGSYEHGSATAHIKSSNDLLVAGPLKIKLTEEGIVAGGVIRLPIAYIWSIVQNSDK